jgi:hypothetical protein
MNFAYRLNPFEINNPSLHYICLYAASQFVFARAVNLGKNMQHAGD